MIKENMHIHSKYSFDSKLEIEDIARILVENKIKYAAITDHVELDREPLPYTLVKLKIRNVEIDKENEKYEGKLKLLKAVEISEPHLYKDKIEELHELDLDFIMGSIHHIDKSALTQPEKIEVYKKYYNEVLKMVEANQIDVIGHLDYINRYYDKDYSSIHQVSEIMHAIKEHNQIIEINTSAARRCNLNLFPSIEKIAFYKIANGSEVIIGTDAHELDELTDNLEQAESICQELELEPIIYQKRKRIIL